MPADALPATMASVKTSALILLVFLVGCAAQVVGDDEVSARTEAMDSVVTEASLVVSGTVVETTYPVEAGEENEPLPLPWEPEAETPEDD